MSATVDTSVVEVFMAGDIDHAKQVVRAFCYKTPCCVTVTPTTYIYRGGEEAGFVIGFRNYPRFPSTPAALKRLAGELVSRLLATLSQDSAMVVEAGGSTEWTTRRSQ